MPPPPPVADRAVPAVPLDTTALTQEYARLAAQGLDDVFGPDFATTHPELVAELVHAWLQMEAVRHVQQEVDRIREALAPLGVG